MRAKDICRTHVVIVRPDDTIAHAARMMREHHVGDVVVVDKQLSGHIPRGVVTDRDLVVGVIAQDIADVNAILVKDVMGRNLIVAAADEEIFDVADRMVRFGVRRMPVVNTLEVLVGIVTYDDIIQAIAKKLMELTLLFPEQMQREAERRPTTPT
jgi:CBS domain-containing protein